MCWLPIKNVMSNYIKWRGNPCRIIIPTYKSIKHWSNTFYLNYFQKKIRAESSFRRKNLINFDPTRSIKLFFQKSHAFVPCDRGVPWNWCKISLWDLDFWILIYIYQFELLRLLSEDPNNTVLTIVRNKIATESKVAAEVPGKKNIFVIQGDLNNLDSLKVSSTAFQPCGSA